ncbi:mechanosensitive ion channel family protein [Thermoflavimicrobium dichotomicum]|uniref:Small conductance mechanosensitive channel n=1 Tax=Thermoflavimicrobium dichotomicum TaxID=46223 RepID=A0A1I3JF74_9BACL|nr:mechanosensitive ion channel family protein [Thermoflavimicrobium dichotomicum]SFI58903.1 small conductance mechanosensitive channel [Thermoflavimicrobium dichotomicum]
MLFTSSIFLTAQDSNLAENLIAKTKKLLVNIIEDPVRNLLIPIGEIVLIIVLTIIAVRMIRRVVDKTFSFSKIQTNQGQTLRTLINSIVTYSLYFIAILTILSIFGINLAPVLAGAGILGLAIGFGAQNLVKDVISGFFLIFERQLEVGDFVQINNQISGTVEEVGLRVTKIREFNQRLHYLSNRMITQVTNYNREKMRAIAQIIVPLEADFQLVTQSLEETCEKIRKEFEKDLIEEPQILEFTNMDINGVQFTIHAVCHPDAYYPLERAMRKEALMNLHRHGIEIAYTRSVIYNPEQAYQLQTQKKEPVKV